MSGLRFKIGTAKAFPIVFVTIITGLTVVYAGYSELQSKGRDGFFDAKPNPEIPQRVLKDEAVLSDLQRQVEERNLRSQQRRTRTLDGE